MRADRVAAAPPSGGDPLASWHEGRAKQALLDFIAGVTQPSSAVFVPVGDRIAVLDADGTIWPERPAIEAHFALTRISEAASSDPTLRERQPYKAALEADLDALAALSARDTLDLVSTSHACMSTDQFLDEARAFFLSASHPTLGIPYTSAGYQPMRELTALLLAHDFTVWVCSAGTPEFARIRTEHFLGVPRDRVIASRPAETCRDVLGSLVIWRSPGVAFVNERDARAIAIAAQIGARPLFVAANTGGCANTEVMRYAQDRGGCCFPVLVHHDHPDCDVTYGDAARAGLSAAARFGFNVVSVKRDWRRVFPEAATLAGSVDDTRALDSHGKS